LSSNHVGGGEDKTENSKEAAVGQKVQDANFDNLIADNSAGSTLLISKVVKGI